MQRPIQRLLGPTTLRGLRSFQSTSLHLQKVEPTPDLYLKDDGVTTGSVTAGNTEDEGSGNREPGTAGKYVVAGVLPSEAHYGVPAGAYLTSDPLEPLQETEAPKRGDPSSTSPEYAHPLLTNAASRVEDGVGTSGAVRFRSAPGKMKDGGFGGLKLSEGVQATENTLSERNPQPIKEWGPLGRDGAAQKRQ